MKVIKKYNQYRRDLTIDVKCENCDHEKTIKGAYDDRNYWDNVVPNIKCAECGKSTNDQNINVESIPTKYPEGLQV